MSSSTKGPLGPRFTPLPNSDVEEADQVDALVNDEQALVDWAHDADTPMSGPIEPSTSGGSGSVMFRKAVDAATKELEELAEQAAAVFDLLAEAGFSGRSLRRHRNMLQRMADKRRGATIVMLRQRRTQWMERAGLDGVGSSRLNRAANDLDDDASPIDLLMHLASIATDERPRRVSIAGGDRDVAMTYAEANNPTTALLDLPFGGPGDVDASKLGRTLAGQHALAISFVTHE